MRPLRTTRWAEEESEEETEKERPRGCSQGKGHRSRKDNVQEAMSSVNNYRKKENRSP